MDDLHPRLRELLKGQGWDGLTSAQQHSLDPLLAGKHVLLVAPTGYGKTEAALLPVLSRMLHERERLAAAGKPWPVGFKILYVTPLRALNRDLLRRLESWMATLGFSIGVRHGDTTQSERTRQSKSPPDLLITTPETVQLLLYGDNLRSHLATVRFAILDEVHDLVQSERGAQLLVALERIEEVIAQPAALRAAKAPERDCPREPSAKRGGAFQRIGVSATIADPAAVARALAGRDRVVEIVVVPDHKETWLAVRHPEPAPGDAEESTRLAVSPAVVAQVRTIRDIVERHRRVLIFHNTRDGAELLASRSAIADEEAKRPPLLGLHHGSLSAEHRTRVEDEFKSGRLKALVATSSLELGIDIGAIDHVVQVASPRSVARLVQRLGRSGHRVGGVSAGTLLATGVEDAWECLAVARLAVEGRLEPLQMRADPLVVLANQLVALTNEYAGLHKEWCRAVIGRAGPFLELDDGLFDAAWQALLDSKTLFADERVDRIARGGRARRHFLDHISLIPDETTYRIIDESTKRSIGTVDDAFVAANLAPGALFVMAGRSWRVLEVEGEANRVRVAPARDLGAVPQWTGSQLPVSFQLAQEVARLRRLLDTDAPELSEYPIDPALKGWLLAPIAKQRSHGLEVPTDRTVTLDVARRQVVVNVSLGTRGNEALGRITQGLLSQRLGAPVRLESDAYRIVLTLPTPQPVQPIVETWQSLDADSLDLLLSLTLRHEPVVRHHLVHVAKHFGALPKALEANKTTRRRLEALLQEPALSEETMSRLIHDRLDLAAVRAFLGQMRAGQLRFVLQGQGPLSHLGSEEMRRLLAPPKTDAALLTAVRSRIEECDVLMACCSCGNHWQTQVKLLPKRIACRRCQSIQIACLRPWNEDRLPLLKKKQPTPQEKVERDRIVKNGGMVASFGSTAARALAARGVGYETAARILQKVTDPDDPRFWREVLLAELTFARTNAFWRRSSAP